MQYGFDRTALMEALLSLMLKLSRNPAFVRGLAADPDLDGDVLRAALQFCEDSKAAMLAQHLRGLIAALGAAGAPIGGALGEEARVSEGGVRGPSAKLRRPDEARDVAQGTGSAEDTPMADAMPSSSLGCDRLPELPGPALLGGTALEAAYASALEEYSVGDFDSGAPRGYNRAFGEMALEGDGTGSGKVRRSRASC